MARIKYYYDTETCKYEKVKTSYVEILLNIGGFVVLAALFSIGILHFYAHFFDSDREAQIRKENNELKVNYEAINTEIGQLYKVLTSLQERDDNIYRVIFEAEPIPSTIRAAGTGGVERYKELINNTGPNNELLLKSYSRLDHLKKQLYIQTKSYDEIVKLAKNKQKMMACLPAIRPLKDKDVNTLASGFGMRIHPIYKVKRMHTGLDFSARTGTPVYATGDGVVITAGNSGSGYGNEIEINHGYGYLTKYAHLNHIKARTGQKVKRGEMIGYVGNTGTSVSPHLHYEVIKNNNKVNPVHYFYNDLNADEYQKLIELSSVENQSLGGN